jgi:hypothetical protein
MGKKRALTLSDLVAAYKALSADEKAEFWRHRQPADQPSDTFLSLDDVKQFFGVSRDTVHEWRKKRYLDYEKGKGVKVESVIAHELKRIRHCLTLHIHKRRKSAENDATTKALAAIDQALALMNK